MKKLYYIIAFFVCSSCGDGVDLPSPGVETDLYKLPVKENLDKLMTIKLKDKSVPMIHCGALHTPEDIAYIKERLNRDPWKKGYETLCASGCAQLTWQPNPQQYLERFSNGGSYTIAMKDVAAAYQSGLRYHLGDGDEYADHAIEIMRAWADKCIAIGGDSNSALGAGLYGYEFAVAGELLRDYWIEKDEAGFKKYQQWTIDVFYPVNSIFVKEHFNTPPFHYWANWKLCNLASLLAIGILTDRRDIYNEGIAHLQTGDTNGRLRRAIYHDYAPDYNFAQWQESGRDQGHTLMCVGLMGIICQLAWSQGDDFFAYDDNLFLRACEYAACCNYTNETVPYTTYIWQKQSQWGYPIPEEQTTLGGGKWIKRAIWALPYYHYKGIKNISDDNLKYTKIATEYVGIEGGGGYYDANSGGYDVLGLGTLMYAQ